GSMHKNDGPWTRSFVRPRSLNETPQVHNAARRRGGGVAARGARAADEMRDVKTLGRFQEIFSKRFQMVYGATLVIAANYNGRATRPPIPMIQNDSGLVQGPASPSMLG